MCRTYLIAFGALSPNARLYLLAEVPMAFGAGVFATVYNLYIVSRGFDTAFIGLLLTLALMGAGASALPAGLLVDRAGARTVLLAASLIAAAGVGVQLATTHAGVLLASSAVAGVGAGAFYVGAGPFLAQNSLPGRRTELFTLDMVAVLVGRAVGSAAGGQISAFWLGWGGYATRHHFWLTLLCAAAVATPTFGLLLRTWDAPPAPDLAADGASQDRGGASRSTERIGWRAATDPTVARLALVTGLAGLGTGLFLPFVNLYFFEALDASAVVFGWLSAGAVLLRLVATLLAPWLAARVGQVRAVGGAQLVAVPLLLLLGFAPTLAIAGLALLLRRAVMNMVGPIQTSFVMDVLRPAIRGAGNSVVWLTGNVAAGVSTLAGGALIALAGYRPLFVGAAVLYAASALLFLYWFGWSRVVTGSSPAHLAAGSDAVPASALGAAPSESATPT